jgi:uncharacterized RDD family membrane protein YckC
MSSRKPGYLIGLIVFAITISVPQIFIIGATGLQTLLSGNLLIPSLPGFGSVASPNISISRVPFWNDQFVLQWCGGVSGKLQWTFECTDPETGAKSDLGVSVSSPPNLMIFGDRAWVSESTNGVTSLFELVDGHLQSSTLVVPPNGRRFLLNGEPAVVTHVANGFDVSTFINGIWAVTKTVALPNIEQGRKFGNTSVQFNRANDLMCLNQGDTIHVFLHVDGCLLYRMGLDLKPTPATNNSRDDRVPEIPEELPSNVAASHADEQAEGWSLVWDARELYAWHPDYSGNLPQFLVDGAMLAGGQPAALIIDDTNFNSPIAHIYTFDGQIWTDVVQKTLPFGTTELRVATCRNGQKSFFTAITSLRASNDYEVDDTGCRMVKTTAPSSARIQQALGMFGLPALSLILGCLLGIGTSFLMSWFTKSDYGFGILHVKLSSLRRRGIARLIDIALIVFSTFMLGVFLTLGLDWRSLAEALNLRVDHPTIHFALRVASILGSWLAVIVLGLVIVQGRWGLTPGKWWCGLRTLRTTLRPCGFARSLAREVVMCIDTCTLLCWTPGILCIAFTNCRQRFGDLVADTIVVQNRSLVSSPNTITAS